MSVSNKTVTLDTHVNSGRACPIRSLTQVPQRKELKTAATRNGNGHCREINHYGKEMRQTKSALTSPLTMNGLDNQSGLFLALSCVRRSLTSIHQPAFQFPEKLDGQSAVH